MVRVLPVPPIFVDIFIIIPYINNMNNGVSNGGVSDGRRYHSNAEAEQ